MLRLEHLSNPPGFHDVSLTLRSGEIVGIAGLVGAGRTELCQAIFGVHRARGGRILVRGREVTIHSPKQAVDLGIAVGQNPDVMSRQAALRIVVAVDPGAGRKVFAIFSATSSSPFQEPRREICS